MRKPNQCRYGVALALAVALTASVRAQQATATTSAPPASDDEVVHLTPFEVSAEAETGYNAAATLAGNRLNTELRDLGNSVSVVTKQFLQDVGAVDNRTLLQYLPNGEVGSIMGNFAGAGDGAVPDQSGQFINPNQTTRVRGLTAADNARDYFKTNIPWDGYNIDRVDFQRGPNSILFGQGSPAGIINAGTQPASFQNSGQLEARVGSFGSTRAVLNLNQVILPKELAFRLALLRNDNEYEQEPAYSLDKRLYAATRYEPQLLNRNGIHTVFKANIEFGDIKSNNPRSLPPFDEITPWFYTGTYSGVNTAGKSVTYPALNRSTYIPAQLVDNNTSRPNHGQTTATINGGPLAGTPNPWYQPWIGNFGQQFASPLVFFGDSGSPPTLLMDEPATVSTYGIGPNGQIDKTVGQYMRRGGVADYSTFAKNARLPFWDYGLYKDKSLTDPSVFNFYKNLLDGPNKNEWQNFRTYNLSLAQTYFNDQIGWEVQYDREWWKGGQEGILSGWKQGIGIDLNAVYADGTPDGKNGEPFANGTPNPNLGRPYITDSAQFSSNETIDKKESGRLTLFARHDFSHDRMPQWVDDLLGSHTVTGLLAEDRDVSDFRGWQRFGTDLAYKAFLNGNQNFNANERTPDPVIFLGPSLINATTASGANIPRPMSKIQMPTDTTIRIFNSHWNKPTDPNAAGYVDPAAVWNNNYYPSDQGGYTSTQSENPANYVGWVNLPIHILDSDQSKAVRDQLTTSARLTKNVVKSKAFVWQGKLWHNFLVATGGFRRDTAEGWSMSTDYNNTTMPDKVLNLDPSFYNLKPDYQTRVDVNSRSWSLVAHLTDLIRNTIPLQVSLFYASANNFQPFSNRVDVYGHAIGAPSGKTQERGILLESRDSKYSLKISQYKTRSLNQSSSAIGGSWFIGTSQAWAANWVNRFEYNWTGDTIANAVPNPDPNNSQYNYAPAPGETLAQAQQREANVITAWRAWQKSVNPDFYKAWGINLNDLTKPVAASQPAGFAVTEDSVSKGYEMEFNASPVHNWRITLNGSKTDAIRTNIGGTALNDFISKYETALNTTPVGDLRIWWGGAGNDTTKIQWNGTVGAEWHQRKLQEGSDVPEMRKYHVNLVTNYDFDRGILNGFGVGTGLRWQSNVVIGYAPIRLPDNTVTFDMANPYHGPAETAVDAWVSYRHKLTDKIGWRIQLNVSNLNYGGDALIPINTQPDGTPAAYRIRPPRTWQLTNTFSF